MADDEEEDDYALLKQKSSLEAPEEEEEEEQQLDLVDRNAEYQIRPALVDKFKALSVKEIIHGVLNDELQGKTYNLGQSEGLARRIVMNVKESVKELGFKRYKLIIQTVLGENKGCGVKVGARCLWDADTDNYATHSFLNDTMFCCVVVFGIYCY